MIVLIALLGYHRKNWVLYLIDPVETDWHQYKIKVTFFSSKELDREANDINTSININGILLETVHDIKYLHVIMLDNRFICLL